MARVFVVQEDPNKNIIPATKYGRLVMLIPFGTFLDAQGVFDHLCEKLHDFSENDYLLLIGDPSTIGLATIAASKICSTVRLLKWDRQEKEYYPLVINTEEIPCRT